MERAITRTKKVKKIKQNKKLLLNKQIRKLQTEILYHKFNKRLGLFVTIGEIDDYLDYIIERLEKIRENNGK